MEQTVTDLQRWIGEHVQAGIDVHQIVGQGNIHREILAAAEEASAELIVMASHKPGLADYLLSANAAHVVQHADCSVMVVRG